MIWFWVVAVLAALLVAALVGAGAWWALRRWRPPKRAKLAPRAPRPLVLLHGVLGFDEIVVGSRRAPYFRGVGERLMAMGVRVHCPRLPPAASVAVRAERLARYLRALDNEKVNLVAHSMGGIDARYALARLGVSHRVASLITIGTPHRGTPIADLGAAVIARLGLRQIMGGMLAIDAFEDLTTTEMLRFNRETPDVSSVRYLSVVGRAPSRMNPILMPSHAYLSRNHGVNDGLVPADSQRWGEVLREIEADHWAQIGWLGSFDAPGLFEELLVELRSRDL